MLRKPVNRGPDDYDVVVVGAGFGGLYAVYRLQRSGLSVCGFEGAAGVGGVWWHNRYPGARVDVDSVDYCYYFSPELFSEWKWTERYAAQGELLRYLNHVADRFGIRKAFTFNTRVAGAQWLPDRCRYRVTTSTGHTVTCRFLVMTTGNLSIARKPAFPGLDEFKGEWVQTSHWPDYPVEYAGRRVAVIGTGSSGVQTIPVVAETASHLYVFQRTPNYSVPAQNGPVDDALWTEIRADLRKARADLFSRPAGTRVPRGKRRASEYSHDERMAVMEAQWNYGGQGFNLIFADQTTNKEANDHAAEFVRMKIRERVKPPGVAEALCPRDHPIGTRRLCLDTNYYETYNRGNVTLVNVRAEPIERITSRGILTADRHYEVDLIIFALGFHAFTGALDSAGIRNERGLAPTDRWKRGPRTYLGLTTAGFPNLFTVTGPGSPSVLANMALGNEQHINFVAECIEYMANAGFTAVEPTLAAEDAWTQHVAECASALLRFRVRNYMVHVNADDQSRVFIPYPGGFDRYSRRCQEVAENGFEGFAFT
jgi:cation diffusion facilitator CzcD-associated flavoprotein CzcO